MQLSQAKLLLLDAENGAQAAMATLNNVLGSEQDQQYALVDETNGNPPPAPDDAEALVQAPFKPGPTSRRLTINPPPHASSAPHERDLWMPTVSALGRGGRHAGARRSNSVLVVRRGRRQHQHPRLQRLSL